MRDQPEYSWRLGDHWIYEEEPSEVKGESKLSQYGFEWVPQGKDRVDFTITITNVKEPWLTRELLERARNPAFAVTNVHWSLVNDGIVLVVSVNASTDGFDYEVLQLAMQGPEAWVRLVTTWEKIVPKQIGDEPSPTKRKHGLYDKYEDFSDGVPSHWYDILGTATLAVDGNNYFYISSAHYPTVVTTTFDITNVVVKAKLYYTDSGNNFYLWVRLQTDLQNSPASGIDLSGYGLRISASGTLYFYRYTRGSGTILWQYDSIDSISADEEHSVVIIARGPRFDLYYDDEFLKTVYDTTYVAGAVGMYLYEDEMKVMTWHCELLRDAPTVRIANARQIDWVMDEYGSWQESTRGSFAKIPCAPRVLDYMPWLERFEHADVRVWDSAENTMDETAQAFLLQPKYWERVYSKEHDFKGFVVVEDGVRGFVQTKHSLYFFVWPDVFDANTSVSWNLDAGKGLKVPNRDKFLLGEGYFSDNCENGGFGAEGFKGDHIDFGQSANRVGLEGTSGGNAPTGTPMIKTVDSLDYNARVEHLWMGNQICVEIEFSVPKFLLEPLSRTHGEVGIAAVRDSGYDGWYLKTATSSDGDYDVRFGASDFNITIGSCTFDKVHRFVGVLSHDCMLLYLDGELKIKSQVTYNKSYDTEDGHPLMLGVYGYSAHYNYSGSNARISRVRSGYRNRGVTQTKLLNEDDVVCWITFDNVDFKPSTGVFSNKVNAGTLDCELTSSYHGILRGDGVFNDWIESVGENALGKISGIDGEVGEDWSIGFSFMVHSLPPSTNDMFIISYDTLGMALSLSINGRLTLWGNGTGRANTGNGIITTNTVYRVLIQYDADGDAKIYVNGTHVGTTGSGDGELLNHSADILIGGYWSYGPLFDGCIDEFMIYNRIIQPEEDGVVQVGQFDFGSTYLKSEFRLVDGEWRKRPSSEYRKPVVWLDLGHQSDLSATRNQRGALAFSGVTLYGNLHAQPPLFGGGFSYASLTDSYGAVSYTSTDYKFTAGLTIQFYFYLFGKTGGQQDLLILSGVGSWSLYVAYSTTNDSMYIALFDGDNGSNGSTFTGETDSIDVETVYHVAIRLDVSDVNSNGLLTKCSLQINGVESELTQSIRGSGHSGNGLYPVTNTALFYNGTAAEVDGMMQHIVLHDYWLQDDELGFFVDKQVSPAITHDYYAYSTGHYNVESVALKEIRPERVEAMLKNIGGLGIQRKMELRNEGYAIGLELGKSILNRGTSLSLWSDALGSCRFKLAVGMTKSDEPSFQFYDFYRYYGTSYAYSGAAYTTPLIPMVIAFDACGSYLYCYWHTDTASVSFDYTYTAAREYQFGSVGKWLFYIERTQDYSDAYLSVLPYHQKIYYEVGDASEFTPDTYAVEDHSSNNAHVTAAQLANGEDIEWTAYLEAGTYFIVAVCSVDDDTGDDTVTIEAEYGGNTVVSQDWVANDVEDEWTPLGAYLTVERERQTVTVRVKYTADTGTHARVDHLVIVPLANGYNWPYDVARQFLCKTKVERKLLTEQAE